MERSGFCWLFEFGDGIAERSPDHIEALLFFEESQFRKGGRVADLAEAADGGGAGAMVWIGEQVDQPLVDRFGFA